jgi:hypothetical protein
LTAVGVRHLLGQRQPELPEGELHPLGALVVGEDDAVVADLDLDDVLDAVLAAHLHFGLLDPSRGVGDVGVLDAHALAEELEPAARAGGLDLGGLELSGLAELLGYDRRKGIHGRGAHDTDVVAGRLCVDHADQSGRREGSDEGRFWRHD